MSILLLGVSNVLAVAVSSYILQEDNFILLAENGDFLTQE